MNYHCRKCGNELDSFYDDLCSDCINQELKKNEVFGMKKPKCNECSAQNDGVPQCAVDGVCPYDFHDYDELGEEE